MAFTEMLSDSSLLNSLMETFMMEVLRGEMSLYPSYRNLLKSQTHLLMQQRMRPNGFTFSTLLANLASTVL